MGRPSKLTDKQWEAIGKRLLMDESAASLAREFGVSKASISARFSKRTETVKSVANQIVETERSLSLLNVSEQIAARSLADELKSISTHLASAAKFGAMTAHRLSGIANSRAAEIPDAGDLDDKGRASIQAVSVLGKMANEASEIGLNLLRANKESIDAMNKGDAPEDMHWTVNLVPANAG